MPIHVSKIDTRQNWGRGGAMLSPSELVVTSGDCYFCLSFAENRSRNATVTVRTVIQTDRWTHALTDAN